MFCALGLVFGIIEGISSSFHVLRTRTHFRQYRGRRVTFSYFTLPNLFSAVPRASSPIFMFCVPGLIFGVTEGVGSLFNVLRARNYFRWYRGRWVPFSYFALPDLFSAVPRASGHVFMFCALKFIFGGTKGVGTRFHILRSLTHFRRYRGRRDPFSCFVRADSVSAVPRASGPIFMFCTSGHVFGGTKGVDSRFHVLGSRSHFSWYRGRRVMF
jgi:hypothetical protein